jgi:hypothetical protein
VFFRVADSDGRRRRVGGTSLPARRHGSESPNPKWIEKPQRGKHELDAIRERIKLELLPNGEHAWQPKRNQ